MPASIRTLRPPRRRSGRALSGRPALVAATMTQGQGGCEQDSINGLVDQAMLDVASLISARGLCARKAALLAHLPSPDLELVAAVCRCESCAGRRPQ